MGALESRLEVALKRRREAERAADDARRLTRRSSFPSPPPSGSWSKGRLSNSHRSDADDRRNDTTPSEVRRLRLERDDARAEAESLSRRHELQREDEEALREKAEAAVEELAQGLDEKADVQQALREALKSLRSEQQASADAAVAMTRSATASLKDLEAIGLIAHRLEGATRSRQSDVSPRGGY